MSFILLGILNSQAEAGAAVGTYDLLQSEVLTGTQATVSFSDLSASYGDLGYKHIQLRMVTRDNRAISGSNNVEIDINGVTTQSYSFQYLRGDASTVGAESQQNEDNRSIAVNPSANDTAYAFGATILDIYDAFSPNKKITMKSFTGVTVDAAKVVRVASSHLQTTTNALDSLDINAISSSFVAGSRFSIYGRG